MHKNGLSIIIPTYNESANIKRLIKKLVWALLDKDIPYEMIVVDDHSTDQTRRIVGACSKLYPVRLITKTGRQGKGYSILQGYEESIYGYIAVIDADTDADQLEEYFSNLLSLAEEFGYSYALINRRNYLRFLSFNPYQGPKVLRREIFEHLDKSTVSAWVIGTPLIRTARELGYRGAALKLPVTHLQRPKPVGVRLFRFLQKVASSFWSLAYRKPIFTFNAPDSRNMLGAGLAYKKSRFITHTTLPAHLSALKTFAPWQIIFFLSLVVVISISISIHPKNTLIWITSILSAIYLIDVIFNLIMTLKSLQSPPELSISESKIKNLKDDELPVYSILCPLYKEAQVLPQFVEAMSALDWPADKLDVLLLLEEDDKATIAAAEAMDLPPSFRIIIVPDSHPKTKPKACNYGLAHVKGEYVVIYDAEDKPDPDQLKKAFIAFRETPEKIACLQAKLNYYNPHHNLLTRLFTTEYSLWFDVILPGLQSLNTSIPLGGTSNHFMTKVLLELKGWDPFNVTEDADLGTRLFSAGYLTAIIDSTTLEEANSDVKNWFRQRSRWLKGYMQTYLVHMRHPLKLVRDQGWHALIFQLVVGGKIAFIMINPFLWAMTISYFALFKFVGPAIEAIYPATVFYMAASSLIVGNFVAFYNYMIGAAKRGHYELIKFVFLIPFYWLAISGAAAIAFFQLIFKPHYWEKTIHGLHLQAASLKATRKEDQSNARAESRIIRGHRIQRIANLVSNAYQAGGVVVIASMFSNVMNFVYNSYLARNLDVTGFGDISLFGSFLAISAIPISALSRSITHKSAYLLGKFGHPVKDLWAYYSRRVIRFAIAASLLWIAATPLLQRFFHVSDWTPFLIFAPVWVIYSLNAVNGGFLNGNLLFVIVAISLIVESAAKFVFTAGFVWLGYSAWVYAAIPLSMVVAYLLKNWQVKKTVPNLQDEAILDKDFALSRRFYFTSVLTTLTSATYLSLDIIIAKHFLTPYEAGAFSYISLAGKMIFFLGSMFSQFLVPYLSRDLGAGKNPAKTFLYVTGLVSLVNLFAYCIFGVFGYITAPILWGQNAEQIVQFLPLYGLAMALFSVSSLIVSYQQVRGSYLFPLIAFLLSSLQIIGMYLKHDSLDMLVKVITLSSVISLVVLLILARYQRALTDGYRVLTDLMGLFKPLPETPPLSGGKLRILIFNWRDLRHKWAGGAEVYIHELSKRWVAKGHKVTVFSGNDSKSKRFENLDGVNIIRRGGFYLVYLWAFLYYQFRFKRRYDVILDSENGIPFFSPLYAKERVYLLIHHVHQEVFRKSLIPPFSWLASFLEKSVMPAVYKNTEIITVSPSSKADILLHRLTKKDPKIVYNGVDLSLCKPGVKSANPMVLYLGRLTTAKSIHILILAAKSIIAKLPDVEIVIAGDGPNSAPLKRLVRNLNLQQSITFLGRVTEAEKINLYQQAWVFVNPSLIEGWGITTIEANACGTPVVASNVAGLMDAVKNPHSGFLVPYGNVEEFAKAITELITNDKKRRRMSRESVTWAQNFDWNKSADYSLAIIGGKI